MKSKPSPYAEQPEVKWKEITRRLLKNHPLKIEVIREVAEFAWKKVWETTIGSGSTAIRLEELVVPATVIGYFFEILFTKELENRFPDKWRGNESKDEKDLVFYPNPALSVEIKTSGQLGSKVYGNRSYSQEAQNEGLIKKEKSGYYITVNFWKKSLTLLRFGWIDASDWRPQASQTGQMAALPDSVYQHKLVIIPGEYRLTGPVELLNGVGPKTAEQFHSLGIHNIRDLVNCPETMLTPRLEAIRFAVCQEHGVTSRSSVK